MLVEVRSIGGLSGSPVFVRETIQIKGVLTQDGKPAVMGGLGRTLFLGLMYGHWDIRESELNSAQISHDAKRGVNLGIGIVVPANKILETINRPELRDMRNRMDEAVNKRTVPGMDSARETEPENGMFTREDFEAALKKVSRKIE